MTTHRRTKYRGKHPCEAAHVVKHYIPDTTQFANLLRHRDYIVEHVRCTTQAKHVLFRDDADHTGVLLCDRCLPQMVAYLEAIAAGKEEGEAREDAVKETVQRMLAAR